MFTRVLTAEERNTIKKFLSRNGVKERHVRQIASRAKRFMPQIEADMVLMRRLLERYEQRSS